MGVKKIATSYEILMKIGGMLEGSFGTSISGVSKALSGVQKTSDTVTGGISKGFSGAAKVITGLAAAAGVTASFGAMMSAANDTQKTVNQLNAVLKSTGGAAGITQQAAINLASSLEGVTTYSKNAVLGSENLLLTFTGIGKDVLPGATEAVLNMSTALGQDTKSSALMLGKALQDPISGLNSLHRVGISFNADQKKQIETLVKSGQTMKAQQIIVGELSKEMGGSARAATQSFSGEMQLAGNKITDVMSNVGLAIMPVVQNILPKLLDGIGNIANFISDHRPDIEKLATSITNIGKSIFDDVTPAAKTLFSLITDHGTAVKNIFLGVGAALVGFKAISGTISVVKGVQDAIDGAGKAITFLKDSQILQKAATIASTVATTVWSGVTKAAAIAQAAFNLVMDANPIALVVIGIAGLIAAGIALYQNWDKVKDTLSNAWVGIKNSFTEGINGCIGMIDSFIGVLNKIPGVNIPILSKINLDVSGNSSAAGMQAGRNALGTDNWRGGLTWVGERGPELINLAKGAQVIPNNKLGNISSAIQNIPNIPQLANDMPQYQPIVKNISSAIPNIQQMINASNTSNVSNISNMTNNGSTQNQPRGLASFLNSKPSDGINAGSRNGGSTVNHFNHNPVYNIPAGTSTQDIKQIVGNAQREFEQRMTEWQRNQRRVSFA